MVIKVYYFFAKICQERQEMQHVSAWDNEILAEFLHHLAEPYASYDPNFKEYEDNAQEDVRDSSFYFGDEDQIDEETLGQRIQDTIDDIVSTKARKQWSTYFYKNLGAIKTKTHIEVATEKLAFLPQEASVALETYHQDHAYVFSLKHHLVPKTLPKYNPHYIFVFLYKQKQMHQKKLEKAIRHLAQPKRKPSIRYQRAKFCLKRHCGLITPAYVAEFQLNDPAQDKFFESYKFTHTNQEKHYYIADALWVWVLEHLLDIFEAFEGSEAVLHHLLKSLNPLETQIFERAFKGREKKLCMLALECLLCRINFPIHMSKDKDRLVFTKPPYGKPKHLLLENPHDLGYVRTLFTFGSLEDTKIKENLAYIPTYTTQLQADEFLDPKDAYSPKAIKKYLDQHVIGQEEAKIRMSLVFSDHYKRINGQSTLQKANAICIGPSGSGKTFLIEKVTEYLKIPSCIVNAASFTPTGYKGEETNQMFVTLYINAGKDIEKAQKGVIALDEIDKLGQSHEQWLQNVQNELLKVVEKSVVSFEYNKETISLKTEHILFVALGHFEKLWHGDTRGQQTNSIGFIPTEHPKAFKLPQFSNEDLMECGMKREFLRRFAVRVIFDLVDIDMLAELFNRRIQPFREEFQEKGSILEFSPDAKCLLIEDALNEGTGMSALDQKIHDVLANIRFDIERYKGHKCIITKDTLKTRQAVCVPLMIKN
ncbi:AAA family ATPase [Helicobacter bizzozeronii]|uniref:AAA family ATPase n=1 Tax=Helicobacter bizzozeronii TaxID=56877 RepID=UPI001F1F2121|nr:AAA family ATPase [Helicobacter bizzozeronii]